MAAAAATPTPKTVLGAFSLAGQTAVIVGGSAGMGLATAKSVLRRGGAAVLVARQADKLESARTTLAAEFGPDRITARVVNSTEPEVKAFWESIPAGSVHHLVVSAGGSANNGAHETAQLADMHRQFALKFDVQWLHSRYASPRLASGGTITLFSGVLSRRPGKNSSILAAVNGAVESLTKALASELGPRLRVNCISPGLTRTDAFSEMSKEAQERMFEGFGAALPCKRVGDADDIGEATASLIANNFITGVILDVDGGALLR
eukprot:m.10087 g.10087  ORF g.10087 m.10087 type:complete len:263 (-) comp5121_c1_seq1:35-823(-)